MCLTVSGQWQAEHSGWSVPVWKPDVIKKV